MPLHVVSGMLEAAYTGCPEMWSVPEEQKCTSWRLGASDGEGGRADRVTRIVLSLKMP